MRITWMALLLTSLAWAGGGGFFDLKANSLDGKPEPMEQYRGKVVLVVNVASKCGFTPQYEGLEKLYKQYESQGLVLLGFPCNDFGGQEPGSAEEIQQFCSSKYSVTFPLFEKISVKPGPNLSPVYAFLEAGGKAPAWNFAKYLIGRDGRVINFYPSATTPQDPALDADVQKALKEKA